MSEKTILGIITSHGFQDSVPKADNATKATASTRATYASDDESKGTIEARLTNLGFKEGTITPTNCSLRNSSLIKQGKHALLSCDILAFDYISPISIKVPPEFAPKQDTEFIAYVRNEDSTIDVKFYTITTNGEISLGGNNHKIGGISIKNSGWQIK